MDTFIEYLVKKKRTSADFLAMIGIAVIASILIFVLFLLMQVFASFGSIVFLLCVVISLNKTESNFIKLFLITYKFVILVAFVMLFNIN